MSFFMWMVAAIAAIVFIIPIVLTLTPGGRERSVTRLGRVVGLQVPESLTTQLADRNANRTRAASIGALVGTAVVIVAILAGIIPTSVLAGIIPTSEDSTGDTWMLLGGTILGLSIGATVSALSTKPVIPEGERFARSGAVELEDYLAPVELIGARVAAAVSAAALIVAGILLASGMIVVTPALIVGAIVITLGLAGLVMFEIVVRRILDRALPVGSPAELAWNDALRARAMRDSASAPLCLGTWGTLALLLAIGATGSLTVIAGVAAVVVFITILAAAIVSIATRPQQHFLRRLWPDVAAQRAGFEATV